MRALAAPFGRDPRGAAARWPGSAVRTHGPTDADRPDGWLEPARCRDCDAALEDLETAATPTDAACILVRYLMARVLRSEVTALPGFAAQLERDEALAFLRALPAGDADRRALEPLLTNPAVGVPGKQLANRLDVVAEAGARRGAWRGAFQLLHAGYDLTLARNEYPAAARIARRLAALASSRGATRVARRWKLRALANDRRAESKDGQ